MDEKYIQQIYDDMVRRYGSTKILPYNDFVNRITTDSAFQKNTYDDLAKRYGANKILSFDDFSGKVKKKVGGQDSLQGAPTSSVPSISEVQSTSNNTQDVQPTVNDVMGKYGLTTDTREQKQVQQYGEKVAEQSIANRNKAIENTIARKSKNLGIPINKNSPEYKREFQNTLSQLQSGVLAPTTNTKTGEPELTRGAGFMESIGNALIGSFKAPLEGLKIGGMSDQELANYYDRKQEEQPEIPESAPSGLGAAFGEAIGGFPKIAGELALNAQPFVPAAGTALATADAYLSSMGANSEQLYHTTLKELTGKGVPLEQARIQAAGQAKRNASTTAIPDAIMMGALGEMGANPSAIEGAAKTFKDAVINAGKKTGAFGITGGTAEASKKVIEAAQGHNVSMDDIYKAFGEGGSQWATMEAMFHIAPIIGTLPAELQAKWKNYMSKVPPEITSKMLNDMQQEAVSSFKNNLEKVPNYYSEDHKIVLGDLLQQKENLKAQTGENENFKNDNEKAIENIDKTIEVVKNSKHPEDVHVDELTGEAGKERKSFEDLSSKEQQGIANKKELEDYGEAKAEQVGEGEEKRYVPKASYIDKSGIIEVLNPIKIEGEKTYKDKEDATQAAQKALAEHYYENEHPDNLKPVKSEKEIKTEKPISETMGGDITNNEPIPTEEKGVTETITPENIQGTKNGEIKLAFENAKEGDIVNHNGESVTVISKGKSRGGNDIIEVESKPVKATDEELERAAADQVYSRHKGEYGKDGATISEIKENHWGEFNDVLSDLRQIEENKKPITYTIDKEQWDKEVKANKPTETKPIENIQGTEERDIEIKNKIKEDSKLNLIQSKDLVKAKDPIEAKNTHDYIKEKYKALKQLIDCI